MAEVPEILSMKEDLEFLEHLFAECGLQPERQARLKLAIQNIERISQRSDELQATKRAVTQETAELRRLDEVVRTRDGRFQGIFDFSPDGLVVSDSKGIISDANDSFLEMTGYSREEVISGSLEWHE